MNESIFTLERRMNFEESYNRYSNRYIACMTDIMTDIFNVCLT